MSNIYRLMALFLVSLPVVFPGLTGPCTLDAREEQKTEDFFKMSLEELMEIEVVTAGKHLEKIKNIPASVVVITREEIETYGYKTFEEILRNIPGFYMIDDYNWLSTVNFGIRGFFSTGTFNDVVILVNGLNQLGDSWGYYPDSKINVPVEAIDRIEVVRGPMSVIYGSGAFMGAINIITDQVNGGEPGNIVSASAGSEKSFKLFTKLAGKIGDVSYVFNGSLFDTEGLDKPFAEMITDPSYLGAVGLPRDASTGGKMEDNRKHFNFCGTFKGLSFNLGHMETKKEVFDGMPSVGEGTLISSDATNISVLYSRRFSRVFSLKGRLSYLYHHYLINYEVLAEDSFALNQVTTNAYEIILDTFIEPVPEWKITAGLYRRSVTYFYKFYDYPVFGTPYTNTEVFIPDNEDVSTNAFFTQVSFGPTRDLELIGGVRFEKLSRYDMGYELAKHTPLERKIEGTYTNDDIKVIPRLAIIWTPNRRHVVKLLYGEAIKQPSIEQNSGMLKFDLPQLEPARLSTLEINYSFSLSPAFAANVSIFKNHLHNLISRKNEYDLDEGEWITYSTNAGHMDTDGLEVGIQWEPFKNLRLDISGTYQDSKNREEGFEDIVLGYAPTFLGYAKASYRFPPHITFALTGRYVGAMETDWTPPWGRLGERTGSYYELNANVRVEDFILKGFFINLNISNLSDEDIRYPTTRSNAWAVKGTLEHGRRFLLSIGYKY